LAPLDLEKDMALKKLLMSAAFLAVSAYGACALELKSPDIADGGMIAEKFVFKGFGCAGGNFSPALNWSNPPVGTRSFALLVHDPDAPTGGAGFWHWVVTDIPASATGLPERVGKDGKGLPQGAAQVATDFGEPGYGGPCPPKGDAPHHYHFTVYALKVEKLDLPPHATASLAGFLVNANSLGKATLTGMFGR
jgi:Raf kinase inhibitor-like YbhB/YbcL family protein